MTDAAARMSEVLRAARELVLRPDNDFSWSSWADAAAATAELDALIGELERGSPCERLALEVVFAPTGPLQELAMSSGWAAAFLALADRFDGVMIQLYHRDMNVS